MTTIPTTKYAKSGDVHIAYQVVGEGAQNLVLVPGWVSHIEYAWEDPSFSRFLRRLASFSRLILLDRRGTGLSDRVNELPTLEQRMDDVRAVMGDRRWRDLLDGHHAVVREQLARFRGREIDTAGDGFLAAFDGLARGVRCAGAIVREVRRLDVEVRAGLHTGECEMLGDKLSGIAVHTGARVASLAGAGEVLVSGTVKDLVAGSGITFEDRGVRILKGLPGEWHLYAVASGWAGRPGPTIPPQPPGPPNLQFQAPAGE
jgi:Adenylate and Guanylate cyclase catalytic domain